ncbi:MAG: leucyl/phenylalanyl-tRNA--protein transferase [Oceanospirillaceae bacterium]|nr:leucyl/phenylalanyl-tRNA--protein transferase [Oceanospirillaceae bacterium]MBT11057.1 leucyl/phenylalanyl-tRNA--protein transferase [Oceanospirillaceae bacterium]|tara:strand:- start:240348 stop:241037 length:690 start_codon:yes stop_codon:yes gene_type:complete
MIDWLDEASFPQFPPPHKALDDPNGLLAAGGRVTPVWLDQAYRRGIFPWNDPDEVRLWWSPAPRAIITPDSFRIPRSVRKAIRRQNYRVTTNLAFTDVMTACAAPRQHEAGTWISDDMIDSYTRLHKAGRALSVEYWHEGRLSGGFYGLLTGQALFGESMFSQVDNASKIAFAIAAPALFRAGLQLIDCQMKTSHLAQFGIEEATREDFSRRVKAAVTAPPVQIAGDLA